MKPRSIPLLAALILASSLASAEPAGMKATPVPDERLQQRAADTERAFWTCDYVATTRGIQFTPMEACADAYNEVKARKFGGDYARMVQWWRERKAAEHLRIRENEER